MTTFPFYAEERASEYERYAAEYKYDQTEPTPWTPLRRDLKRCKAALVTTAGLRLKTQHMFAPGSAEFREISVTSSTDDMAFDFTNYDPSEAEKDLNVVLPVDRLKGLAHRGLIQDLNETFFSFLGGCAEPECLGDSAHRVGDRLRQYGCDVVFVVPANHVCNQTAGLLARCLERQGFSTVCAVTIKEVAQQIRVPRGVFINFPFGRTFGPAHDAPLQEAIVGDMARALKSLDRPGKVVDLPYRWSGPVA